MNQAPRPRSRRPIALLAWLAFFATAAGVLFLGSDEFDARTTSGWLSPILDFLFGEQTPMERWQLHYRIRKAAHFIEYAILGTLALLAVMLSLRSAFRRRALLALLCVAPVAIIDEGRQSFSSQRTGAISDVAIDLSGAILALMLGAVLYRIRTHRREAQGVPRA